MANYSKIKVTKFFIAFLVLSLSVGTMFFMLSGCGGSGSQKFSISGKITAGGLPLQGLGVDLSGHASKHTSTDANGNYKFKDVEEGIYMVTPSGAGTPFSFTPSDRKVFVFGLDATGFDFNETAQDRIAGSHGPLPLPTAPPPSETSHTLLANISDTAFSWGSNSSGQLGDGTTGNSALPVTVSNLSDVTAVSAGSAHSIALKNDQTVWTWGDNSNGQLGNGTTGTPQTSPKQVSNPLTTPTDFTLITAVSAGLMHSVALATHKTADTSTVSSTVYAWGDNTKGQLGTGNTTDLNSNIPVEVKNLTNAEVIAIAAGSDFTIALKNDGTVWAWGDNTNGQLGNGTTNKKPVSTPVQVSGLGDVAAIAAGASHAIAVKKDGTVWTWGDNGFAQLGIGNTNQKNAPVQVEKLKNVIIVAVAAGSSHTVVLAKDGTVQAWGDNSFGQLGIGSANPIPQTTPTPVSGFSSSSGVIAIACGSNHTLALKRIDQTTVETWAWGDNSSGQLGIGSASPTPQTTPIKVSFP